MDPARPRAAVVGRTLLVALIPVVLISLLTDVFDHEAPFERVHDETLAFVLQTEAFTRGELALADTARGVRFDWAYSDAGTVQLWGLGVPILRLPFDAAARAAGGPAFPGRVVLLLALFAGAAVFFTGLRLSAPEPGRWREGEAAILTLAAFLGPAMLGVLSTRLGVYELVVAHHLGWALLSLGLLLAFAARPTPGRLLVAAGLAGFTALIRPTGALYGGATALLLLAVALRAKLDKRWIAAGAALFAVGPGAVLLTNRLRFGHPLEFGYRGNVSLAQQNDFALRFGSPFQEEGLGSAVQELFTWLFLRPKMGSVSFFTERLHPLFSETLRYRDSYFHPFDLFVLGALLVGIGLAIAALRSERVRAVARADRRVPILALWALLGFLPMAAFYLRSPSMASRYAADFHPAFTAAIAAVALALPALAPAPRLRWARGAVWGAILVWLVVSGAARIARGREMDGRELVTAAELERQLATWRASIEGEDPPLGSYECETALGDDDPRAELTANGEGWYRRRGCTVGWITILYLDPSPCVAIEFERGVGESLEHVRAMANLRMLERVTERVEDGRVELTFCHAGPPPARAQQVSVAWADPMDPYQTTGFRLLRASTAPRPEE